MRLFNSLSKKLEELRPSKAGEIGLYTCGPTLYDRQHIGNLRTFMLADTLRRVLTAEGYQVKSVMNVTDVEDKIIAKLAGRSLEEFTEGFFVALKADLAALGIEEPIWIRATEKRSIVKMGELIAKIMERGYAYERDGSIYLSIEKYTADFPYGLFQKIDPAKLQATGRVDADEYDKDSPQDFALWKAKKPGEPSWTITVDGKTYEGRPGWHIECSAMTEIELGEEFDIHLGGSDLQFPHHENEVAQSRAAHGKLLARYWLHGEMLFVEGQKMSKSLGNLVTLDEIREKGYDPLDLRYLFLQAHYRSKQNFTWEALEGAKLGRWGMNSLEVFPVGYSPKESQDVRIELRKILDEARQKMEQALQNDLNSPEAIAALAVFVGKFKERAFNDFTTAEVEALKEFYEFEEATLALGLLYTFERYKKDISPFEERRDEMDRLRANGEFQAADEIRSKLREEGMGVVNTASGPSTLIPLKR